MKCLMFALPIFVLVVSVSGCGSSPEALGQDQLATIREITTILEGIKDDASAEAALPKLDAKATHLAEINKKLAENKTKPADEKKVWEQVDQLIQATMKMQRAREQAMENSPKHRGKIEDTLQKANVKKKHEV